MMKHFFFLWIFFVFFNQLQSILHEYRVVLIEGVWALFSWRMASTVPPQSLKRSDSSLTRVGDQPIITPLGAGNEVGRSCVYMSYKGKTILVYMMHYSFILVASFYTLFSIFFLICLFLFCSCSVMIVWLWNSSRILRHGCFAILWWDWSFNHWCPFGDTVYSFSLLNIVCYLFL